MKQYRITSENLNRDSDTDCYLDPTDPIHEIKALAGLGGLGGMARLHEYKAQQMGSYGETISAEGTRKAEEMRKNNIQPGTQEWFKLWFSKPLLTGEQDK